MAQKNKNLIAVCLFICAVFSANGSALEGTGLQISAGADLAGQFGLHKNSGASDQFLPREVEIGLYAPADHLFDGAVNFAAHWEGELPTVELHEAYIGSSKLIPRSRFKLGFFFLGVGRINQIHRHDWPFITAPKVHSRFFANEGALDTGLEYSYLTPLPFFLELTAGVTNGFTFGHEHTAGARPLFPTHYLRALTYTGLPWKGGMQVGANYLGRTDDSGEKTAIFGVDVTAKWRESTQVKWLFQSEFWYRTQTPRGGGTDREFGFYIYPEYHLGKNLFLGLRVDYFTDLRLLDSVTGSTIKNWDLNFVPTISYRASHFSTIRLALNVDSHYELDRIQRTGKYVELQTIFILGAHPAHDF